MQEKNEALQERNRLLAPKIVRSLQRRKFAAYYCDTAEEALEQALTLIPEGDTVSWGGSVSIHETGLIDAVYKGDYAVIDRDTATTMEERFDLMRQSLLCDTYLTSFNAISEDGVLINIDSVGNRVAAITFGPKSVVAIVGMNKVCSSVDAAIDRARTYAAPINAHRQSASPFLKTPEKTPCAVKGGCGNCKSDDCICSYIIATRMCRQAERIKIILVGETLGF